ncbi:MAG: hypothetical protein JRI23_13870 [Deltaproteobacteria bacterium]|nr:hypothetical protein [Deltaproteobacteria bacterium]MBW2532817.1 hypothetical protein [Deltaproteobacteria bacterium]
MSALRAAPRQGLQIVICVAALAGLGCNELLGFEGGQLRPIGATGGSAGAAGGAGGVGGVAGAGGGASGGRGGSGPSEPTWVWATALTGPAKDSINDVAVELSGIVAGVGEFEGELHVGDETLTTPVTTPQPQQDAFVVRLAADGGLLWARQVGDEADSQVARAVCYSTYQEVYVTGFYAGTMDFDGTVLNQASTASKVFVASYGASGDVISARTSSTGGSHDAYAIVPTGEGGVVVGGSFGTSLSIGGVQVSTPTSERAGYVARLPLSGTPPPLAAGIGHQPPGSASGQEVYGLAVRPSGSLVLGGATEGPLGSASELGHDGAQDAFVVELDPTDGSLVAGLVFGSPGWDSTGQIALDQEGNTLVVGIYSGDMTVGSTTILGGGGFDLFVAKLDSDLNLLWIKGFPGSGEQYGQDVVADGQGNVLIVGANGGEIDFGGGSMLSQGGTDGVIACFDPDGEHLWSMSVGGSGQDWIKSVDWHAPSHSLVVGGRFTDTLPLGAHSLVGEGDIDSFVAKLALPTR